MDDTPDGKVQTCVYRRDLGIRAHPARKGRMRKLSYEWLAGLREIVIDPVRCPLTYEEFVTKEYERDRDGTWLDIIPDGSDHSIDAVLPSTFHMSANLDTTRVNLDVQKIVSEIVSHLQQADGVELELTFEVKATAKDGFSVPTKRAVSENCGALHIADWRFDD